jgi:hypothetical protein
MKSRAQLTVSVWTTRFLGTRYHALGLLRLLQELDDGRWAPDCWGSAEPARLVCDQRSEAEIVRRWTADRPLGSGKFWNDVFLLHQLPRALVWVVIRRCVGAVPQLNHLCLDLPAKAFRSGDGVSRIKSILHTLVKWSDAAYASIEYSGQLHTRKAAGTPLDRLDQAHWLNYFGRPYLEIFGRQRVLETPAFAIEPVGSDGMLVQASARFDDPEITESEDVLSAIENHLGRDAFATEYWENSCRVPLFDLSELQCSQSPQ